MLNLLLESTPLKQIYLIENSIELQIRQKTDTKKRAIIALFLDLSIDACVQLTLTIHDIKNRASLIDTAFFKFGEWAKIWAW